MGDFHPFLKPWELELTKFFDVGEGIHAAKHTAYDHEKYGTEVVALITS